MKAGLLAFGASIAASPALAQDPLGPLPAQPAPVPVVAQPAPPSAMPLAPPAPIIMVPKDWRGVFDAIDSGNWASARAGIATLPPGVLTPLAKAELYTAKGSPTIELYSIEALVAQAPELPQADQLARMALSRGATTPPLILPAKRLFDLGSPPARYRARPVQGEHAADQLRAALEPLVKANDAAGAEAQLLIYAPQLSFEARAEAAQRVAWINYVLGLDTEARRVADTWRQGANGEWASHAAWVSALASWRLNDCESASRAFRQTASLAAQRELRTGALYWAARSEQACRRPRSVEPLLRAAAGSAESFYGLLARETLGMETRLAADSHAARDPAVDHLPNVQRARELVRIGEPALAEQMIRHQAKIGNPAEHHALIQLTKQLNLPALQLWLANNGQHGAVADAADRYPNPNWAPVRGWRVEPSLAFAHAIQESRFQARAVSPIGAVGLLQVRPGTAADMARGAGMPFAQSQLTQPTYNLEFGQSFIEMMRRNSATAGQLPRVIASYNAGPLPVGRWASINDKGDPLLWMESIPYWETRYYVPAVLRNMWVYQGLNRQPTPTLKAMAEHHWPAFPTGQTGLAR